MMAVPAVAVKDAQIPLVGLGTWELRGRECTRLVDQAIRLGYRHFDTAQLYGNEREVGEGVRASGIRREEVFVVTKVAPDNLAPGPLMRSVRDSIGNLRLGEIDLLLLHWPNKGVPLRKPSRPCARSSAKDLPAISACRITRSRCLRKRRGCPANVWSATRSNAIPISTRPR